MSQKTAFFRRVSLLRTGFCSTRQRAQLCITVPSSSCPLRCSSSSVPLTVFIVIKRKPRARVYRLCSESDSVLQKCLTSAMFSGGDRLKEGRNFNHSAPERSEQCFIFLTPVLGFIALIYASFYRTAPCITMVNLCCLCCGQLPAEPRPPPPRQPGAPRDSRTAPQHHHHQHQQQQQQSAGPESDAGLSGTRKEDANGGKKVKQDA
ncbi:hypothetical protein CCH79_00015163 [Gambusia affinis]|uniref:Uncharacterized protein n=1 Tax=Gambusia affinis TaxID=33528 RepID=A0A315VI66_GAMAF|nr:hypothetical protein CCH79_00015163 [Gambusia affinis]